MSKAKKWMIICLVICLLSSICQCLVQNDFGKVDVNKLTWETPSGRTQTALLLVPKTATAEKPAPAIVTSHGWFNSKEWQDMNYIEYARRGYVVISIDMYGHGDSDVIYNDEWWLPENGANGMYDAVQMLATLPFVDASRIGVTGHSNGGLACLYATELDDAAEEPLISAVLLVCQDSKYTEDNNIVNHYGYRIYYTDTAPYQDFFGARDAGIIAAQYDEFFSRVALPDGTHTSPKDFITTDAAQSFLYFGVDPAGQPVREAGKEYEQGGFLRAVYTPNCIHPAATYNPEACAEAMQFFDAAFGAPNPIDPTSQIWMVKMFAGAAGVIALIAFAAFFMLYMIEKEDFKSLATIEEVKATPFADKAGKGWYWCGFIVCALFALISYPAIYRWVTAHRADIFATQGGQVAFFQQLNTFYIGLWSLMCAVVMFIITVISYNAYGKKHGVDLRDSGVILPKGAWWKTIKLSLLTVIAMMSIVYISDHFFTVDYRIWIWPTFRAFKAFHWAEIWKYFIFFVPYYVMLSVSTNCFNYKALGKKGSEGLGLFVNCLSAALAPLLFIAIQYIPLYVGGHQFTEIYETGGSLVGLWLFPVAFILPFAVILGRAVYKKTKNPYLVGIMMGVLIAIVTASNQLTNP